MSCPARSDTTGMRRRDHVDDRLERLGELLHLADDGREEVGDEAAQVEADVAELDELETFLERVADLVEADQVARVAIADRELEVEVADDLREHLARARHEVAVELELQIEVDDRVDGNADVDAQCAEIADADQRCRRAPSRNSIPRCRTPRVAPRWR